ncbi:SHOCT domain-containing protein [Leifsonia poae]|uniref:SHOCT domain-containing protein n=1 Tax=Leifsonia poae TaxID=110933 RepID=UPI003D675EDE
MNFWDFAGYFFWTFIFIAYLMALFTIMADLFRDDSVSGWGKAVWIIFLIFVPFLTAFVYLIARGRGMAERQGRARQVPSETDAYLPPVPSSPSEDIAKAKALADAGTITPAEYEALKAKALGQVRPWAQ